MQIKISLILWPGLSLAMQAESLLKSGLDMREVLGDFLSWLAVDHDLLLPKLSRDQTQKASFLFISITTLLVHILWEDAVLMDKPNLVPNIGQRTFNVTRQYFGNRPWRQ